MPQRSASTKKQNNNGSLSKEEHQVQEQYLKENTEKQCFKKKCFKKKCFKKSIKKIATWNTNIRKGWFNQQDPAPAEGTPAVGTPEVGEARGLSGHKLPALIEVVTGDIPKGDRKRNRRYLFRIDFKITKDGVQTHQQLYFKIAPYEKEGYYDRLKTHRNTPHFKPRCFNYNNCIGEVQNIYMKQMYTILLIQLLKMMMMKIKIIF